MDTTASTDTLSREAITDLLASLVRIPSVNPALAPGEGTGEAAVAAFARDWLQARGMEAWLEEAAPERPNVVARCGRSEGPAIVLCAHLDTVATEGMTIPPFEPVVEGGRLYGRGSYDMKGGVCAAMAAAAALAGADLPGTLLLALVADEEYASIGAADFVRRHPADACIVTEPSEGRLVLAHKGFVWVEIEAQGRASHGSRWDLGESAVAKMGPILTALDRYDRNVLRRRTHPLVGPASLHPATIGGGTGWSTYAASCTLRVERRTLPGETPGAVLDELRRVVRDAGVEADVRAVFARSPSTCAADEAVAQCVRDAARHVTGVAPGEVGVAYWMDAAVFTEAGIPTVNIGPGGAGAHAAVEWVDVESVVTCARVLAEAVPAFLTERSRRAAPAGR